VPPVFDCRPFQIRHEGGLASLRQLRRMRRVSSAAVPGGGGPQAGLPTNTQNSGQRTC
jgi:hypothetical protein